jgi:serine/threonine protein kinase
MNQLLRPQQVVRTEVSGSACRVETFIERHGQGEVYKASLAGSPVALKWYFSHAATADQRRALEDLVAKGPPNEKFLWPMEVVSAQEVPGYGYIMPLRDARFKGLMDLMKGKVQGLTFRALATAGYQLAESFFQLHSAGLCYRDISFGNVFFDPASGDVLICDNDNVGVNRQAPPTVLGTPRFMAPEIVRREVLPSTDTDLYSLAVLLFYMFLVHHPLEGKRERSIHALDQAAMNRLYGTHPLFIFDPRDDSNGPDPRYHQNVLGLWQIYPQSLRDKFTQSFTEGLRAIHRRVRENEWRTTLVELRDAIYSCLHCHSEVFFDAQAAATHAGSPGRCWNCGQELKSPIRLRIRDGSRNAESLVVLTLQAKLYFHHVDSNRRYDFSAPVAEVVAHPRERGRQGLKNLSPAKWVMTNAEGVMKDVEPGRAVTLAAGTKISFGGLEGELLG